MSSEPSKKAVMLRNTIAAACMHLSHVHSHVPHLEKGARKEIDAANAALDAHIADLERRVGEAEAVAEQAQFVGCLECGRRLTVDRFEIKCGHCQHFRAALATWRAGRKDAAK